MLFRNLNKTLIFFIIFTTFILRLSLANDENEDQIKITHFVAHNDFAQSDTFKVKQPIIFHVLWNIPKGVTLKGKAILTIEGEQVDGKKWAIKEKKDLRHEFPTHYWEWDSSQKIPKNAKPGSVGTATIELKIEGYETVKEVLTFNIEK